MIPSPATLEITSTKLEAEVSDEFATLSPPSPLLTGKMEIETLILSVSDRGKSKNVYKVCLCPVHDNEIILTTHQLYIDGDKQVYVAKKYFDAGTSGPLSKTENKVALANDLFRLKRLAMFRQKYVDLTRFKGFTEIAGMSFFHLGVDILLI